MTDKDIDVLIQEISSNYKFQDKGYPLIHSRAWIELCDAIDSMRTELRAAHQWRSVEDELPDDEQTTWIWPSDMGVVILKTFYAHAHGIRAGWFGTKPNSVTHWMPIPASPTQSSE